MARESRSDVISQRLQNKVAVITGASKGLGAAIDRAFGAEGALVVVNYSSSKVQADQVVADVKTAGGKAIAVKANMTSPFEVQQLFAEAKKAYGRSLSSASSQD